MPDSLDGQISGADGGDAGGMPGSDGGGPGTICGARTCAGGEFCHVNPTAACTPNGGGTCGAATEPCEREMVPGCTRPQARTCRALPQACAALPNCTCLLNTNPCPGTLNAKCRLAEGSVVIQCPFP
jgi:hypothetical protein